MLSPFTLPHIEDSPKRIRALFGSKYVIDSKKGKLVWEHPEEPAYYFPAEELSAEFLELQTSDEDKEIFDVVVGDRRAPSAVTRYTSKAKNFGGLLTIEFDAMDAWFEEEEEVFIQFKDPYKRIDVLQSSRHIRVEVNGVEVANTRKPRLLFETGLRVRTYIPKTDCRLDLLEPSDLTTKCPYKGVANYYHVRIPSQKRADNVVWWYSNPIIECAGIQGFIAFYDEKLDVWVDGEKQKR